MSASLRLKLCTALVMGSAVYAVLIVRSPDVASAIAVGYIAALLTVLVLVNVWKHP